MPIHPVASWSVEPSFSTWPLSARIPIVNTNASDEDDRRVAEREEEADAERPLAFVHQLARRVVDRRDVVGIEGVAESERVGGDPDADRERPRGAEAVGIRRDEGEEEEEADDVEPDDHGGHPEHGSPLAGVRLPLMRCQRLEPGLAIAVYASISPSW